MSDYIIKRMEKLQVTDEDIVQWANANGYGSLLPDNLAMVRQIYIDANDDDELEFPDLEMRGKRVAVKDIPPEEWVIIRVFMFKIARTTGYPMCPEDKCYARVSDSTCQAREEKSHGYVAEAAKGVRHYYLAGDAGEGAERVYVIVPAKYAMNDFDFEYQWCDVKGIWNDTLEGFFANTIIKLSDEELARSGVQIPVVEERPDAEDETEEVVELPKGLDLSAFAKKPTESKAPEVLVDEDQARLKAELANFLQIIPFFSGYALSAFDEFIHSNDIKTPIEELIEQTPGCSLVGDKVIYVKRT
jgi:hypothetical protein